MKAALLTKVNEPLEIHDVEVADPAAREVRLRTAAVGVCHSDLHFQKGSYPYPLPTILGHEAAGVVEAVGSDVRYVRPGDHVITCLSAFCGHCEHCLTGRPSLCDQPELHRAFDQPPRLSLNGNAVHQFLHVSAFAENMLVHEHALAKIRKEMPLDRAALIGCAVTTGVGAVIHTASVEAGTTVAVIGCGGIGLSCINGAALVGAGRIIAVDTVQSKLDLAEKFGATSTVNASECEPVEAVKDLAEGGVHYAFEAVGLKQTTEQAWKMLRTGGCATVIGMIPVGTHVEIHGPEFLREKKLQGSNMGSNRFRIDMPRYVDFYLGGRLQLDELISDRVQLSEVNEALANLETGRVARSVIVFE